MSDVDFRRRNEMDYQRRQEGKGRELGGEGKPRKPRLAL